MIMNSTNNEILPQGYRMTELGPLPEEWEVVRLGEVAEKMKAGGTPRRSVKEYWGGNIPFVLIEDMTSCNLYLSKTKETITEEGLNSSSAWLVPPNTILLSMYATIGETAINTIPVTTNQAILAIIPKDNFDTVFGAYILKYNDQRLIMQNIQSTQKNVNKGIVDNFKIPLPPLPEQQKIAAVLSAVQEAKEKTQAVIDATKALKKSMMKHLFTYGPVPPEETEDVPLKETEIGKVPEEWEVVKLGEVFEFSKKPKNLKINDNDLIPFIPMEMISDTNQSIKYWEEKSYSEIPSGSFVFKNDIIIAKITPSFENGKQAILDKLPLDYGYATTEIWALHPKNENVITQYLYYYLKVDPIRMNLAGKMEGSTGRQRLPKHVLENLSLPLPPLPVQQKIASILSAVDAKIEAEENKKQALEELFKTLLHNLMTAKIRVNNMEIKV